MSKAHVVNLTLLLIAVIWGAGFVPQKLGMDYLGPSAFNALRFVLGALTLAPVMLLMPSVRMRDLINSSIAVFGTILGLLLFLGALMQQVSLQHTSVANVSFITGLYAIIVPIIGYFLGYRYGLLVWFGGLLAIVGLYFMTSGGGNNASLYGDLIALAGAMFWAVHLLVIVRGGARHNQIVLAFYQFLFCAVFSLVFAMVFEDRLLPSGTLGYMWALLNGVIVVGVAYTLQVMVLSHAEPFTASLILSLEAVFGAVAAYFAFGEVLGLLALFGAALMLIGCVLAQREEGVVKV